MLYSEIIAVCSQIHTKHMNTLCGQNVELLSVKPGGTDSNHWAWSGLPLFLRDEIRMPRQCLTLDDYPTQTSVSI
jgi:hypothetical protein